jgi:hypothetical protein
MDTKSPQYKAVKKVLDRFPKANPFGIPPLYDELEAYIPVYLPLIIPAIARKVVELTVLHETNPGPASRTLDFLLLVLKSPSDFDTAGTLMVDNDFLPVLFLQTRLNAAGDFDQRVLEILEILLAKQGNKFVEFLLKSKQTIFPLIHACTRKRNTHACTLANQLVVSHPEVRKLLIPDLKPLLQEFPAALTVDLMLGSVELKETMTEAEFDDYLFKQPVLTMSDVSQSCRLFTGIWVKPLVLDLFLRTTPPEKFGYVDWIHRQPAQDLVLEPPIIASTVEAILRPRYAFDILKDPHSGKEIDTCALFMFTRLYVLSFADPNVVGPEGIEKVYEFIDASHPYVAGAALQVLGLWIAKFEFMPERRVIYKVAAQINGTRGEGTQQLCRVILGLFARIAEIGQLMLRADVAFRFVPGNRMKVTREVWEFPHFSPVIDLVVAFPIEYDQKTALAFLGEIVDYLQM